jgi:general secretion pathway protein F
LNQQFRYRAATVSGDLVEGVLHAGSARDAADELRRQTLVPVSIESEARKTSSPAVGSLVAGRHEAVAVSLRTISTLLSSAVSLERALDFAARHASHPAVAGAFGAIRSDVQRGVMLSEAVRAQPTLGAFAASVCHAGEESGTLDQALARLADWFERKNELRSQVRAALMYPALMGVVAGLGVVILLSFVVPRFVEILGDVGGELPLSTRLLVGASNVFAGWWWLWLTLIIAAVLVSRAWLSDPANRRRWHAARLRIPGVGALEQGAATARFAGALSVLLNGGTSMLAAVRVAAEGVSNTAIAAELDGAAERIARGERVAESLSGALPPLAVELLAAGEESGRLPEMCERVAKVHEESVGRSLRSMVRLIEPVLILVFGAVVGFIALALLQAVYSVNIGVL